MCTALIELYWFNGRKRSSYLLLYQRQLMFINDSCVYQRQLHQPVFINDSYISLCLSMTATSACVSCHRCSGLIIIMYDFWDRYVLCDECMLWQGICFVLFVCAVRNDGGVSVVCFNSYDRIVLCDRCTHAVAVASLTVADVIPTALTPQRHHTTMRNFQTL